MHSFIERRGAGRVARIHIGSRGQQHLYHVHLSFERRLMQRRHSGFRIPGTDVRAVPHQDFRRFRLSLPGSFIEWRSAVRILAIHLRAVRQQEFQHGAIAPIRGQMKSGSAAAIRSLDIGAVSQSASPRCPHGW